MIDTTISHYRIMWTSWGQTSWRLPGDDDFLGTDETYPVKIGSVPMSFDSLMGYFSSVPGRPGRRLRRAEVTPA